MVGMIGTVGYESGHRALASEVGGLVRGGIPLSTGQVKAVVGAAVVEYELPGVFSGRRPIVEMLEGLKRDGFETEHNQFEHAILTRLRRDQDLMFP